MIKYYTLNENNEPVETDLINGLNFFESAQRYLKKTRFKSGVVSTVFLIIDHNHWGNGEPLLFETMIFGSPVNEWMSRCARYDDAMLIHKSAEDLLNQFDKLKGHSWRRAKKNLPFRMYQHEQAYMRQWFGKAQYKNFTEAEKLV